MAALKVIGTGEVSRERKITSIVFGIDQLGNKGLAVTFQEQLFKDNKALNDKTNLQWNYTEANITSAIPEVQALYGKLETMLESDTQADSLIIPEA